MELEVGFLVYLCVKMLMYVLSVDTIESTNPVKVLTINVTFEGWTVGALSIILRQFRLHSCQSTNDYHQRNSAFLNHNVQ